MSEYDSEQRKLTYPLKHALVFEQTTEDDDCIPASSFVWPEDSDERVLVPFMLSLNEYVVLSSAIDVGSDIAYGEDALRVMWLWQRNMRCEVSLCDAIASCITSNPGVRTALLNFIKEPATITQIGIRLLGSGEFMGNVCEEMAHCLPEDENFIRRLVANLPPSPGNDYPPIPTPEEPGALCNAATYIVGKVRDLIVDVYVQLATIEPGDVFLALLGQQGWSAAALFNLITTASASLESEIENLAEYDAAVPDLICALVELELDKSAFAEWIALQYGDSPAFSDLMYYSLEAAMEDGRYALWATVGAQTPATCELCGDETCDDFIDGEEGWSGWQTYAGVYHDEASGNPGWGRDSTYGVRIQIRKPGLTGVKRVKVVVKGDPVKLEVHTSPDNTKIADFAEPTIIGATRIYTATLPTYTGDLAISAGGDGVIGADVRIVSICTDTEPVTLVLIPDGSSHLTHISGNIYEFEPVATGHYFVGGAIEETGQLFKVIETTIITGTWGDGTIEFGGAYWSAATLEGANVRDFRIDFYNAPTTAKIRFTIAPA